MKVNADKRITAPVVFFISLLFIVMCLTLWFESKMLTGRQNEVNKIPKNQQMFA